MNRVSSDSHRAKRAYISVSEQAGQLADVTAELPERPAVKLYDFMHDFGISPPL